MRHRRHRKRQIRHYVNDKKIICKKLYHKNSIDKHYTDQRKLHFQNKNIIFSNKFMFDLLCLIYFSIEHTNLKEKYTT